MSGSDIELRPLTDADAVAAASLLDTELGGRQQARLGELVDVLAHAGMAAWSGDALVGIATYAVAGDRAELAALAVAGTHRNRGIGARLLEAAVAAARAAGAAAVWLVTTNDNLDALRLYQRHEFRLVELRAGAVDRSRRLKPHIPHAGDYGIPLRDELVLERTLDDAAN